MPSQRPAPSDLDLTVRQREARNNTLLNAGTLQARDHPCCNTELRATDALIAATATAFAAWRRNNERPAPTPSPEQTLRTPAGSAPTQSGTTANSSAAPPEVSRSTRAELLPGALDQRFVVISLDDTGWTDAWTNFPAFVDELLQVESRELLTESHWRKSCRKAKRTVSAWADEMKETVLQKKVRARRVMRRLERKLETMLWRYL